MHREAAAIAIYLCEPESDGNAIGLLPAPLAGDDYPIWRVV